MVDWRERVFSRVCRKLFQEGGPASIMDIGGGEGELCKILKPAKYVNVNKKFYTELEGRQVVADIECDLNHVERLPADDDSFEMVSMCHILEHLNPEAVDRIIEESQRVSGRYILIGLPNELLWFNRIRILFGINTIGVTRFGHHYMYDVKEADRLAARFDKFQIVKRLYVGKKMPAVLWPSLTAFEIYYLLEKVSKA